MPFDINARIEEWRTHLLDTSKRNRLISFKSGRTGGIDLVHPDPGDIWHRLVAEAGLTFVWQRDLIELPPDAEEASKTGPTLFDPIKAPERPSEDVILEQCRRSPRLRDEHVLTKLSDRRLAIRLSRLALNARESLTEQGVNILYVAFGFLRWFESPDSKEEIRSPLLLVPVRLERASVDAPWKVRADDEDILPNQSLAQLLTNDFRLRLPLPDSDAADADTPRWRTSYFGEVERCIRHLSRWEVLDEAALGTFSFQKLAMWDDLGRNGARIARHDLCRAVAGDQAVSLRSPAVLLGARELDQKTHPAQTFHILDADSSQHEAIVAATGGANLVLDGPPGTGKSQTIANVIAESLAANKTVLFVSEKAAALEVVQRRLQERGLGDFCLACHSHKVNKQEVVNELARCLGLGPVSLRDPADELQRLHEARQQLNAYVRELHAPRPLLGLTVFQVQGELARLSRLESKSRCPVPQVLERDAAYLRRVIDLLAHLPDCRAVIADLRRHPWRGCKQTVFSLTLRDDVRHHFSRLASHLDRTAEATAALIAHGFCVNGPSRAQWRSGLKTARSVLTCPHLPASWFSGDPRVAAEAAIQLDKLSREYRQVQDALPEFALAALRLNDANALTSLGVFPAEFRPLLRAGDTVKSLLLRLPSLGDSLSEMHRRAVAADEALQRFGQLIGTALPSPSVRAIRGMAEMADLIVRLGPIRPSWWDAGRRQELQGVITRCQEEARAAQEVRGQLVGRLALRAFAPESAALAKRASGYRSFLSRWLPAWWSLKDEITAWYSGQAPTTETLLGDMDNLVAYHRRIDYSREVQEHYANDLLRSGDGQPDWDGTLEALKSVERLTQLTKIPATLRTILSTEGSVDLKALAAAGKELEEQGATLHQHLEASGPECGLDEVTDRATGKLRLSVQELIAWLAARVQAVAGLANLLARLSRVLAEGRDVPVESLPARLPRLYEMVTLQTQITVLVGQVWPGQVAPQDVEEQDWQALRDTATALLGLLNHWRVKLPLQVVRVLTVPDVRAQLTETIRQIDATSADGVEESWRFVAEIFDLKQSVSTGITVESVPLTELRTWLRARAEDADRMREWIQFCEVEREVASAGVAPILTEVLSGQVKPEEAGEAFRARFLSQWLDAIHERAPVLRQFTTDAHERLIARFRELDSRAIASAATRIRAMQLSRPERPRLVAGDSPGSSELGTVLREANKKKRHMPLRKLFATVPNLLLRLKPCLMMSPLAVSTYLNTPDIHFDLVIFDEASQVRPHDAICAIYRGRQLIVAGDQKQLPPTSFFDRVVADEEGGDDEDEGGLENFESILDVCCSLGLTRRRLRWHYRSRREGLIAFANRFVYGNELVTFPSVHDVVGNPAVTFEYVEEGRWKAGTNGGFNEVEARRTAELVLEHFRQHPDQSLGVIAFNQRQQLRIMDELELLRKDNPDQEAFFHEGRDEPFFVKNLENVQGDERDVIFLGIGYGPDETGRLAMRFGPLNLKGGERRLNVAVTRARLRMTVVSSMHAQVIDLSRTSAVGVKLLKAYLDYAERGMEALGAAITGAGEHDFDSPFEREVHDELTRRGLTVHPQVGSSAFRIDLAIVDPKTPGRYILGVECDGATYHSSATARDRDRLRQEVLESLGWWICRIWSTDWMRNRETQVQRVQAALEKSLREGVPGPKATPVQPRGQPAEERPVNAVAPAVLEAPTYGSIDDVPETILREMLCRSLDTFGATEADDLIRAVARQLGFARTGARIQARIKSCVDVLIATGQVIPTADQRLQTAPTARTGTV